MMKVYTIGHSNKEIAEFISILKECKIKNLVDVRRFPTSKFHSYKKENLMAELEKEGIKYHHLVDLGGYRKEGYKKWMKGSKWESSFKKLEEIASKLPTVIMCAERFPWKCHRRFITKKLKEEGFETIDLID
jgi:uncharacterized protein (DUF488 family)